MGIEVLKFSLDSSTINLLSRVEKKYSLRGPINNRINQDLIEISIKEKPNLIMIWIGTNIYKETILRLRENGSKVISYIHDDPFTHIFANNAPSYHKYHFKKFIDSIPYYDHLFFSKSLNVDEAYTLGARSASILMQYYVPDIHFYTNVDYEIYKCDIAFAGHFENDGRDQAISRLADFGYVINIYGDFTWRKSSLTNKANLKICPRADGLEYSKAIASAKICLCFMSKLNRDQYTTRCFEIPAIGSLLLAERTNQLSKILIEDEEAVYFSSTNELIQKTKWLMENPEILKKISMAGMRKIKTLKHSISDRAEEVLRLADRII